VKVADGQDNRINRNGDHVFLNKTPAIQGDSAQTGISHVVNVAAAVGVQFQSGMHPTQHI
jgi:hypothetical protein